MKCDLKSCLNCELPECVFDKEKKKDKKIEKFVVHESKPEEKFLVESKSEEELLAEKIKLAERNKFLDAYENKKRYNSVANHEYYLKHKAEINQKHKERYRANREKNIARSNEYYRLHREEISKRRKERREKQKMLSNTERVRALLGNLKNWSWDIHPQFRIEKEDADALREYLKNDPNVTARANIKGE